MALSPQAHFDLKLFARQVAGGDYGSGIPVEVTISEVLASGTGSGQATKVFQDVRTLALSTDENLDFQTLLDPFGTALGLTKIKWLIIQAASANAADLRLTPGSANGWDAFLSPSAALGPDIPQLDVQAGTALVLVNSAAGYVVDAAHKVLNVENLSGAASGIYTITIVGI